MKIVFASNNAHKLQEIRLALGHTIQVLSLAEVGFEGDIPETGPTLESNALEKARYIFEVLDMPVFADDSGLEVDCLHGAPGVDTAHYCGSRDAMANMDKLLRAMCACTDRSARFRTVIAYTDGIHTELFQGETAGSIAPEMRGNSGFGYDPVFVPRGQLLTFAEMGPEAKRTMNHRVKAVEKLVEWIQKNLQSPR